MTTGPTTPRPSPALIGVDWGTTSRRMFLMGASGEVLARDHSEAGILNIVDGKFAASLEDALTGWLGGQPALPIILSGMITSRQGWKETPYLDCPAPVSRLAAALHPARSPDGWRLWFISGLACRRPDGTPDVMRGEETQVLGVESRDGVLVLPGTHSKWVELRNGAVAGFTTYMTGELFATLRGHSILGRLMADGPPRMDAFDRGVRAGLDTKSGLLARLFGVRTHGLFDDLSADALADYLSGLLIGTEFKEALAVAPAGIRTIMLVGRSDLVERYARAAGLAGVGFDRAPQDAAARGHFLIAREAGLI